MELLPTRIDEQLDIGSIERTAESVSLVLHETPYEVLEDPKIMTCLLDRVRDEARAKLSGWVCAVTADQTIGCYSEGVKDRLVGEFASSFTGVWTGVDIMQMESSLIRPDLEGTLVPGLVFETLDDERFESSVAMTFPSVYLPLIGTLVYIQRLSCVVSD